MTKRGIIVAPSDIATPTSDSFPNVRVNSVYTTPKPKSTYKQGHKAYKSYAKKGLYYGWCKTKPIPIPYKLDKGSITERTKHKLINAGNRVTICPIRKCK